jgi:hypothetical protein
LWDSYNAIREIEYSCHGHISTLHLWWARRPLPVCRAIVFASIVPDPLDEYCPQAFKDAVQALLGNDTRYAPYPDIPYTAVYDPMPDNLRNLLLMFIGKFSPLCQANMLKGKITLAKDQLDEGSLIKWDNKNDREILGKARKPIWVSYNAGKQPDTDYETLSRKFDAAFQNIELAEEHLYDIVNRHLDSEEVKEAEQALQTAIKIFKAGCQACSTRLPMEALFCSKRRGWATGVMATTLILLLTLSKKALWSFRKNTASLFDILGKNF